MNRAKLQACSGTEVNARTQVTLEHFSTLEEMSASPKLTDF